eukprot:scaffold181747_cov17-Tisochrysis_lutea.AAC.1
MSTAQLQDTHSHKHLLRSGLSDSPKQLSSECQVLQRRAAVGYREQAGRPQPRFPGGMHLNKAGNLENMLSHQLRCASVRPT